jgi:hypothetical protein
MEDRGVDVGRAGCERRFKLGWLERGSKTVLIDLTACIVGCVDGVYEI